ncbi:MAG TPA: S-methyl-5-thioribose-1-phosphate isomerase [Candidatus Eremiobacteraceae bacterium]|nr:S-methyl-5-thioribose-1-phosphate isomerase [Candidatus Eremiobacteraceae bacterium]
MTPAHIVYDNGVLTLLDQTKLPATVEFVELRDARSVASAISRMIVRGAPAIGITGAYGVALAVRASAGRPDFLASLETAAETLSASRPTAVNLAWAVGKVRDEVASLAASGAGPQALINAADRGAKAIHDDDIDRCRRIGDYGASLLPAGKDVMTHCNTGSLATGGYGTALGVIRSAWRDGRIRSVLATETRPLLQGARLTAWELLSDGIPHTIITDSMAGHFMKTGVVGAVMVGADRIARNGDTANKIGTYGLAVLARAHGIPFIVAAPLSTFDLKAASGADIPIEQRDPQEVTSFAGVAVAPAGSSAANPAFDVTPAEYITTIVTERGALSAPFVESIDSVLSKVRESAGTRS